MAKKAAESTGNDTPRAVDDYYGISFENPDEPPYAYVGDHKWEFHKLAVTQARVDKVLTATEEYDKVLKDIETLDEVTRLRQWFASSRKILEATLDGFDWIDAASTAGVGPANLSFLAVQVRDFVARGGAGGARQLLTLSRRMQRAGLPTTRRRGRPT